MKAPLPVWAALSTAVLALSACDETSAWSPFLDPSLPYVTTDTEAMALRGDHFAPGAVVVWDGLELQTTAASCCSLAVVPPELYAGTYSLQVRNPDGLESNVVELHVQQGFTSVTSVHPASAEPGVAFDLTLHGTGFQRRAHVFFNQLELIPFQDSSTVLQVQVPARAVAVPSTVALRVAGIRKVIPFPVGPVQARPAIALEVSALADWSADRRLYVLSPRPDGQRSLRTVTLDTGDVLEAAAGDFVALATTADGESLYVLGSTTLRRHALGDLTVTGEWSLSGASADVLDVSPTDPTWVASSRWVVRLGGTPMSYPDGTTCGWVHWDASGSQLFCSHDSWLDTFAVSPAAVTRTGRISGFWGAADYDPVGNQIFTTYAQVYDVASASLIRFTELSARAVTVDAGLGKVFFANTLENRLVIEAYDLATHTLQGTFVPEGSESGADRLVRAGTDGLFAVVYRYRDVDRIYRIAGPFVALP